MGIKEPDKTMNCKVRQWLRLAVTVVVKKLLLEELDCYIIIKN